MNDHIESTRNPAYGTFVKVIILFNTIHLNGSLLYFLFVPNKLLLSQMQNIVHELNLKVDSSPLAMYNFFIERVRQNLHVVLTMSPIGDAFRNRLRMFPSLINCCTIDWFQVKRVIFVIFIMLDII